MVGKSEDETSQQQQSYLSTDFGQISKKIVIVGVVTLIIGTSLTAIGYTGINEQEHAGFTL
ncbi:MAG: hypothetical protein R6U61_04200 [Thermoplasmata archaeon]